VRARASEELRVNDISWKFSLPNVFPSLSLIIVMFTIFVFLNPNPVVNLTRNSIFLNLGF
jgi:hypothetical protein